MRILYVIEYFYPYTFGGAEESTLWQAHYLNQRGHTVSVLTPNYGAEQESIHHGVTIYRFPFFKKKKGKFRGIIHKTILWHIWSGYQIFRYSKKLQVDVVHVQGKFSVPGAILSRMFGGPPVIATLRDYAVLCHYGLCLWQKNTKHTLREYITQEMPQYMEMFGLRGSLFAWVKNILASLLSSWQLWMLRVSLKRVNHLVYVSKAVERIYHENGFKDTPSSVVYNMAPVRQSASSSELSRLDQRYNLAGKRVVLFVGKLSQGKGADMLLRTIPYVFSECSHVHYVFAGTMVLSQGLIVSILGPDAHHDQVTFLGRISQDELALWYTRATVVPIPSMWQEPLGRVGLEALSYQKPLVTSRQGGFPEMLESVDGAYLVDVSDTELYAKALIAALKNPKPTRLPAFLNPERIAGEWEELYQLHSNTTTL